MSHGFRALLLCVMLMPLALVQVYAQDARQLTEFPSAEQQALFNQLTLELRCLKCQNQTIADSPAGLAEDLRREVREQVLAGASSPEIKDYMVQRYGDFILYRPRLNATTLMLWLGPLLLLLAGLFVAWRFTRNRQSEQAAVDETELAKARSLLDP